MEIQIDHAAAVSQVDGEVAIDLSGNEFAGLLIEIEAEARALGPESVARNEFFKERALLAGLMLQRRLNLGWTQKELGDRYGLDQAEISRIENLRRDPRYTKLAAVAHALGYHITLSLADSSPISSSATGQAPRRRRTVSV